jgi:ATP-dependent Lhr-like helicase
MPIKTESSFSMLHPRIQRFIHTEGWQSLRGIQNSAIPVIMGKNTDVIISASTASGKTEAAFFPALTDTLALDGKSLIIYISPIKALINDQFKRLNGLCEKLDIRVWPWHGDISDSLKKKFRKHRRGVLLITPEALEATLCNHGEKIHSLFENVNFIIIIDEIHAFIGNERGKQLQSLLHRIDNAVNKRPVRIGLSATLGDISIAAEYIRPNEQDSVKIITADDVSSNIKLSVKGYFENESGAISKAPSQEAASNIAEHIFNSIRGVNNLIFPNSRSEVEKYTHLLTSLCATNNIPNEFFPHHGSLAKTIRHDVETALKESRGTNRAISAVCTSTMELGIDIGDIINVVQINTAFSVASLRQRMGRSGRSQNRASILRCYCIENRLAESFVLEDYLRLNTLQMLAIIQLLIEG